MRLQSIILALCLGTILSATSDDEFARVRRAQRRVEAHTVKVSVAQFDESVDLPRQDDNGDQQRYRDLRGTFNKGLEHLSMGFPDRTAFNSLFKALSTGSQIDFDSILIGQGDFKLVNPQGSLAFSLDGNDAWLRAIPPAPMFASAQAAGEMVELYWTVLLRDVPFNDFIGATGMAASTDLSTLSDFRGPKIGGVVTPATLLRGNTPGDLIGPYISQFLYQDIPWGGATISSSIEVPVGSTVNDFLTTFATWFDVVTGGAPTGVQTFGSPIFIRTPRDLTEYVHRDTPGQAALGALLLLNQWVGEYGADMVLDPATPYLNSRTQDGFVTFGIGQYLDLLRAAVQEGLKAAWYHKWQVNRRLRPEEYGFYVQQQIDGMELGISSELISSPALPMVAAAHAGFYFLPTAYPEGSPVHPSYPAGHATFIGAAVTILKAIFNEDFIVPDAVEPNAANTMLDPSAALLTVGGELNKLAANISLGRDHAGVHYRSDGFEGMNLGEKIAIDILNNESFLFNEGFAGYTLTKFDGTVVTVGQKR